jgi:hypothetical protein
MIDSKDMQNSLKYIIQNVCHKTKHKFLAKNIKPVNRSFHK